MGVIENVVRMFTKQKCVAWLNPRSDGKGGFIFDPPIEIDCRWEDKEELKEHYDGNMVSSQAKVLVNFDIPRRSYLMNIKLSELQAMASEKNLDINNPREFYNAFVVIQFEKIPMVFSDNDFARTAFLYDQG